MSNTPKLPRINSNRYSSSQQDDSHLQDETANSSQRSFYKNKQTPLLTETKFTQLESKLIILEQTNSMLHNKILQQENAFNHQLKLIESKLESNKSNSLSSLHNSSSNNNNNEFNYNDLKSRIIFLEKLMDKESQLQTAKKQKELDAFKHTLQKATNEITSTVLMEVRERNTNELSQKEFSSKMYSKYDNEIAKLHKELQELSLETKLDYQNNNQECSDRNQQIVKYIEQQIKQSEMNFDKKLGELNSFVKKLTYQVNQNMINQQTKNETIDNNIQLLNNLITNTKNNLTNTINTVDKRLPSSIIDHKRYIEINMKSLYNKLTNRFDLFCNNVDDNINAMSTQLIITRQKVAAMFNAIEIKHEKDVTTLAKDLHMLRDRMVEQEKLLHRFQEERDVNIQKINKTLSDYSAQFAVNAETQRMIHKVETQFLDHTVKKLQSYMYEVERSLTQTIETKETQNKDELYGLNKRIRKIENSLNELDDKSEKIKELAQEIQVAQIVSEMTTHAQELQFNEEISNVKKVGKSLNDLLVKCEGNLESFEERINDMKDDMENKYNEMGTRLKEHETQEQVVHEVDKMIINLQMKLIDESYSQMANNVTVIESKLQEQTQKLIDTTQEFDVKLIMADLINSTESAKIYAILQEFKEKEEERKKGKFSNDELEQLRLMVVEHNEATKKALAEYSDVIDNKVNQGLEEMKKHNLNLWTNTVSISNKLQQPEEIKRVINEIPSTVYPLSDTLKRVMDLGFNYENGSPFVPQVDNAMTS